METNKNFGKEQYQPDYEAHRFALAVLLEEQLKDFAGAIANNCSNEEEAQITFEERTAVIFSQILEDMSAKGFLNPHSDFVAVEIKRSLIENRESAVSPGMLYYYSDLLRVNYPEVAARFIAERDFQLGDEYGMSHLSASAATRINILNRGISRLPQADSAFNLPASV